MENGRCREESRSREIGWVGKNPKEHTLVLSMCTVPAWQGPRNQASWNRQMKEGKWAGMGACTPGRMRKDSSA